MKTTDSPSRSALPWRTVALGVALVLAVLALYGPALHGTPVWDDEAHMTLPKLRSAEGLWRIWTEPGAAQQYYPLTHTLFWLEHRLWGEWPLGHHLVNVLMHLGVVALLWRVLLFLRVPGAGLAAALFALHPVQVESVAWISELKNTLSGVLYLGAALLYLKFEAGRRRWHYAGALGLFLLALASKTVVATLPAALLVVFWWQRGKLRWRADVVPLLPFFALGIGAGLFTAWMEKHHIGAEGAEFALTLPQRLLIAGRAPWFYLGKLLWPHPLVFIYPRWVVDAGVWWQWLFPLAFLLLLAAAWRFGRGRGALAGLLFFVGTLFPALGFINVYPFRYSFVADHFQYLASIGPLTLLAVLITRWSAHYARRVPQEALAVVVCALLVWLGRGEARQFENIETLWTETLRKNPDCWMAQNNLGLHWMATKRLEKAAECFEALTKLQPQFIDGHVKLGNVLLHANRLAEARRSFEVALKIDPQHSHALVNLGNVCLQEGKLSEAEKWFQATLDQEPDHVEAHNNLGNVLQQKGWAPEAIKHFRRAIELKPGYAEAHNNLGNALLVQGHQEEALHCYEQAVVLSPAYEDAHYNLGNLSRDLGKLADARKSLLRAVELAPEKVAALNNLAWLLATCPQDDLRDGKLALQLAQRANTLSGGTHPIVLHTLAAALAEAGEYSAALIEAAKAQRIARGQGNPALADSISAQVDRYERGQGFRDPEMMRPAPQKLP